MVLSEHPELLRGLLSGDVLFGTLDTFLVWKLTGGAVYATDYSNASATGLFDPFALRWASGIVPWLYGGFFPPHARLPPLRDTSGDFGACATDLFGAAIPIAAVVADQQAALFGECCFNAGECKVTLGTGGFLDVLTGPTCLASRNNLYPLVAWKIGPDVRVLGLCVCM